MLSGTCSCPIGRTRIRTYHTKKPVRFLRSCSTLITFLVSEIRKSKKNVITYRIMFLVIIPGVFRSYKLWSGFEDWRGMENGKQYLVYIMLCFLPSPIFLFVVQYFFGSSQGDDGVRKGKIIHKRINGEGIQIYTFHWQSCLDHEIVQLLGFLSVIFFVRIKQDHCMKVSITSMGNNSAVRKAN